MIFLWIMAASGACGIFVMLIVAEQILDAWDDID